jgi:gas vesicle protein
MAREEHPNGLAFVLGFTFGLAVGAGAAILFAPESGRRTRRTIQRAAEDWRESATEKWRDVREEARDTWGDVRGRAEETARRSATRARERIEDLTGR